MSQNIKFQCSPADSWDLSPNFKCDYSGNDSWRLAKSPVMPDRLATPIWCHWKLFSAQVNWETERHKNSVKPQIALYGLVIQLHRVCAKSWAFSQEGPRTPLWLGNDQEIKTFQIRGLSRQFWIKKSLLDICLKIVYLYYGISKQFSVMNKIRNLITMIFDSKNNNNNKK